MSASREWQFEQSHGIDLRGTVGIGNCPRVAATDEVAAVFQDMALLDEQVWIAGTIDRDFRLIYWRILGKGYRPTIAPIDVFSGVILTGGLGAFLVRNSLRRLASRQREHYDKKLLHTICNTAALLGYAFFDYVIVSRSSSHSLIGETVAVAVNGDLNSYRIWQSPVAEARLINASR